MKSPTTLLAVGQLSRFLYGSVGSVDCKYIDLKQFATAIGACDHPETENVLSMFLDESLHFILIRKAQMQSRVRS